MLAHEITQTAPTHSEESQNPPLSNLSHSLLWNPQARIRHTHNTLAWSWLLCFFPRPSSCSSHWQFLRFCRIQFISKDGRIDSDTNCQRSQRLLNCESPATPKFCRISRPRLPTRRTLLQTTWSRMHRLYWGWPATRNKYQLEVFYCRLLHVKYLASGPQAESQCRVSIESV